MMASEEQAIEQVDGEEDAEEQGLQEVKEIPHATPIAAGMQPPYDEDFNPFSEAGMQVEKILFLSLSLSPSLSTTCPSFSLSLSFYCANKYRLYTVLHA